MTAVTGLPVRRLTAGLPFKGRVHSFSRYVRSLRGSSVYVCSSMSTNSGFPPACEIASGRRDEGVRHRHHGVALWTPAAISTNRSASVPLATPTVLDLTEFRELALEVLHLRSADEVCGAQRSGEHRDELFCKFYHVWSHQVQKRDRTVIAHHDSL